jgi:cell division protein FtsI (penicillin-binding protein 3)
VSAPAAGRVIARIGPMLGLLPDTADAAAIDASLAIPLEPARPSGARGPLTPPPAPLMPDPRDVPAGGEPGHVRRDLRHEALWTPPGRADAGRADE